MWAKEKYIGRRVPRRENEDQRLRLYYQYFSSNPWPLTLVTNTLKDLEIHHFIILVNLEEDHHQSSWERSSTRRKRSRKVLVSIGCWSNNNLLTKNQNHLVVFGDETHDNKRETRADFWLDCMQMKW